MRKIFYCIYDMKLIFLFTVISYVNKLLSIVYCLLSMGIRLRSIQGVKMGDVLVLTDRYMLVIRMAIL